MMRSCFFSRNPQERPLDYLLKRFSENIMRGESSELLIVMGVSSRTCMLLYAMLGSVSTEEKKAHVLQQIIMKALWQCVCLCL